MVGTRGRTSASWGLLGLFLALLISLEAGLCLFLQDEEGLKVESKRGTRQQKPYLNIYDATLEESIRLFWQVNEADSSAQFEIHVQNVSHPFWFAVGFSDRGDLVHADMCVLWYDWKNRMQFQNAYVDDNKRFTVYQSQVCDKFQRHATQSVVKFAFSRRWRTCQPDHYVMERGTTHVVWSLGIGVLYSLEGVLAEGGKRGMTRLQILKPSISPGKLEPYQLLEVKAKNVHVPSAETTYWCYVYKLPDLFMDKHHVVEFGPSIEKGNEDVVHHMELFHCEQEIDTQIPLYEGPCRAENRPKIIDSCKRVLAAWAMGAEPFVYPQEAGLPIGGEEFNPYVMLEIHYNNPHHFEGKVDNSGIFVKYTSRVRAHDAGVMELGLEYTPKMAIPPQAKSFIFSGYCISECTALGLPPQGIYIFGSQLHTHLTGVRTWTKHYRRGKELTELNRDNHYSTHFQEIRRLPEPVNVLPGDALIMECEHSTMDRENVTLGGFSISDEMCVNYVHYYPKVDLEVCKSSIDTQTLENYFDFMKRIELQDTSPDLGWRENYQAIEWTPLRSVFLQELYENAPISMQCNKSNGDRFPGYWDEKPSPIILEPLSSRDDFCSTSK